MRVTRGYTLDLGLLLAVLAVLAIGLPAVYSASHGDVGAAKLVRQAVWAVLGLAGLGVMAVLDYRVLSRFMWVVYVGLVLVLLVTPLLATEINGARSWIALGPVSLQPSELGKLALVLFYGALLARVGPLLKTLPFFTRGLILCGVPLLLVLVQPDFGTAVVYGAIWLVMTLVAGARAWMILAVLLGTGLLFSVAWQTNLIKPYQKKRLDFVHADPLTAPGYQQHQARIAIGSGGLWGKGYLRGTQAQRGFLPEQDTDFIYAVVGEEFGFLGLTALLGLYLYILHRLLRIAEEAETRFGRYVTAGVFAMLAMHILINVGMCLTLFPVTGVPLPLVSYGGSNLFANLLAIGVVLNISRHRENRRTWVSPQEALVRL